MTPVTRRIAAQPAQSQCLPGSRQKVRLAVTDQAGRPAQAELSLALLKEGIFRCAIGKSLCAPARTAADTAEPRAQA